MVLTSSRVKLELETSYHAYTDGTLKKETEKANALFEVVATYPAMGGYEKPMIDVKVL